MLLYFPSLHLPDEPYNLHGELRVIRMATPVIPQNRKNTFEKYV